MFRNEMSSEMLNSKCMSRDKSSDEHKTKLDAVNEEVRKFKYLNQKYNLTLSFSNYKYADCMCFSYRLIASRVLMKR